MNRIIKFRAYIGELKKVFPVININARFSDENGHRVFIQYPEKDQPEMPRNYLCDGIENHIMQFTGLLDKNGREIYEGDVIRATTRSRVGSFKGGVQKWGWGEFSDNALIVYCEPSTTLVKHLNGTYCSHLITIFSTARDCDGFIEIIGNIFENPDLIK